MPICGHGAELPGDWAHRRGMDARPHAIAPIVPKRLGQATLWLGPILALILHCLIRHGSVCRSGNLKLMICGLTILPLSTARVTGVARRNADRTAGSARTRRLAIGGDR
jgi:hypothetical protein